MAIILRLHIHFQRATEVPLKQRRPLIVMPREMPQSLPYIDNMKQVTLADGIVMPAAPGWCHGVTTLRDPVDFIVARNCDQLGIDNCLMCRWGEE